MIFWGIICLFILFLVICLKGHVLLINYANIKNNRSERDLYIYDLCICDLYHMHFTLKIIIFNANESGMFVFLPVQATDRLKTEAELAKQDEERLKKLEVSSTQSSPS